MTEQVEKLAQCTTQQLSPEKIRPKPLETIKEVLVYHQSIINGQSLSEASESCKKNETQASKEATFGEATATTDKIYKDGKPVATIQNQKEARIVNSGQPPKRRKTVQGPRLRKEEKESSEDDEEKITVPNTVELSTQKTNKKRQALKRCSSTKQHNFEKYRPPALNIKNLKQEIIQRIPSEDYGGHIFQPSKKMLEKQKDLNETILDLNQCKTRTFFLINSVPLGTRLTFEVIVEKDSIFSREYSFWLGGEQGKVLLMHCKKNLKLLQDYYIISEYIQVLNCYNFMAKLQSNALRKQFILSNQIEHIVDPDKQIFADINVCGDPINNRQTAAVVYFPAFDKYTGAQTIIKNAPNKEVLKQLAKEGNKVSFLTPCSLQKKMQKQFMFENGLLHSKRSVTLMDQQGWPKLHTSKLQTKKYRIYAGSGVSPLIIFSTFIVLYQS